MQDHKVSTAFKILLLTTTEPLHACITYIYQTFMDEVRKEILDCEVNAREERKKTMKLLHEVQDIRV